MRRQTNVVSALVQNGHTLFLKKKAGLLVNVMPLLQYLMYESILIRLSLWYSINLNKVCQLV